MWKFSTLVTILKAPSSRVRSASVNLNPLLRMAYTLEALIYLSLRGPFYDWSFREDYVTKVRNGAAGIGVDAHTLNQLQNIQIIPNAHVA